jgi:hypothetical protein
MQSQSSTATPDDIRWASADILRITIGQLRSWQEETTRHCVIEPKADEDAWEGTEIDVRRTVL